MNYLLKNLVENLREQPEPTDKRTKGNTCHTKLSLTALREVSRRNHLFIESAATFFSF